jgi:hypothetical protein
VAQGPSRREVEMRRRNVAAVLMVVLAFFCARPVRADQKPLTQSQVMSLVLNQLGDETGAKVIQQRGIDFDPSPSFLKSLKDAGASDTFVQALQKAPRQSATPCAMPSPPQLSVYESWERWGRETAASEAKAITEEARASREAELAKARAVKTRAEAEANAEELMVEGLRNPNREEGEAQIKQAATILAALSGHIVTEKSDGMSAGTANLNAAAAGSSSGALTFGSEARPSLAGEVAMFDSGGIAVAYLDVEDDMTIYL